MTDFELRVLRSILCALLNFIVIFLAIKVPMMMLIIIPLTILHYYLSRED